MFQSFRKKNVKSSSDNSSAGNKSSDEHGLLPIKLYLGIFVVVLMMTIINVVISMLPLPSNVILVCLLFIATIQAVLVSVFFMELIHEDKFYSLIFGSSVLFMLLFFAVTLGELSGRDFFTPTEGIRTMREMDQNGNYAPGGPKIKKKDSSELKSH